MDKNLKKAVWLFMLLIISVSSYAQKDVTQFLSIPVDGSKSEMIKKLKAKGFTSSTSDKDVLVGEFNGIDVYISIATNNNKVCRIGVADVNSISEGDIKIRFNNLLQQFQNNNNYLPTSDSTLSEYTIPKDEDISYELSVNNKRYQAVFYQKTAVYDSLVPEMSTLYKKEQLTDADKERMRIIFSKMIDMNKKVWFMISEFRGKYYISMYYDNEYNRAKGEGL